MAGKPPLNDILRSIIDHQGRVLLDDPERCAQVLQGTRLDKEDVAGLMSAVTGGIPKRLMRTVPARITNDTVMGLAHKLAGDTGLSADMARQSVEAWAYALHVEVADSFEALKTEAPKTEPPKTEPVAEPKVETVKPVDPVQPTPPPPTDNPAVLLKPPLKIKAALLTPVGAIAGGIIGIIVFGFYYVAVLFVMNFVFQHHLSQGAIGEIAGETSVVVGMPCGVLAGISWVELRYKYDWLGWTVAAVMALIFALYPFVAGIVPVFKQWGQFNALGIFALFGVFGIAAKFDELKPRKRF
jgi:hypothetical protein